MGHGGRDQADCCLQGLDVSCLLLQTLRRHCTCSFMYAAKTASFESSLHERRLRSTSGHGIAQGIVSYSTSEAIFEAR